MHLPVLLKESVDLLITNQRGIYIDGTLGRGGHGKSILEKLLPEGKLIGIDRDIEAIKQTKEKLKKFGDQALLFHGNFAQMKEICEQIGVNEVDGIFMDLGVSSPQLDVADRGFSFSKDGPLDMRMDQTKGKSAEDLVNSEEEEVLADIIYKFGEERDSRRIARAIVKKREKERICRTLELAEIVEKAKGGRRGPSHPATKTFQALRMAVNSELENLEAGLESGLSMLREGGRMAVITFHSLEDRVVKQCFRRHEVKRESLQQGGEVLKFEEPAVKRVNRKPLVASTKELGSNPRARSAKLRVVERESAA